MSKANPARVQELVDGNDKDTLVSMAEERELDTSGTKQDIATRIAEQEREKEIAEQEQADIAEEKKADNKGSSPSGTPAEESQPKRNPPYDESSDQTKEADMRREANQKRQEHIAKGGDPDAPLKEESELEAEDDEDSESEAEGEEN